MLFLEASLAIFKRLTGYPLDQHGRPLLDPKTNKPLNRELIGPPDLNFATKYRDSVTGEWVDIPPRLPSYGVRIPMVATAPGTRGSSTDDPSARLGKAGHVASAMKQVPVFEMNTTGKSWEDVFPCVTFRWTSFANGKDVPYHEPFVTDDTSGPQRQLLDEAGDVIAEGYEHQFIRPMPDQVNVTYMITCHARDTTEMSLLCACIMELFPQAGALVTQLQDGSEHACDMFRERAVNYDDGGDFVSATQGPEGQQALIRAFYYIVETYMDNTTNQYGVQETAHATRRAATITEAMFEIATLQDNLVRETFELTAEEPT